MTQDRHHRSSITFTLHNGEQHPISIQTGVILRTQYPAANFSFQLQLRDGRRFELFCAYCAPAGVFGGTDLPYIVTLAPGANFAASVAVKELSFIDGQDQHLCMPMSHGATVTLRFDARANVAPETEPNAERALTASLPLRCSKLDTREALVWERNQKQRIIRAILAEAQSKSGVIHR